MRDTQKEKSVNSVSHSSEFYYKYILDNQSTVDLQEFLLFPNLLIDYCQEYFLFSLLNTDLTNRDRAHF